LGKSVDNHISVSFITFLQRHPDKPEGLDLSHLWGQRASYAAFLGFLRRAQGEGSDAAEDLYYAFCSDVAAKWPRVAWWLAYGRALTPLPSYYEWPNERLPDLSLRFGAVSFLQRPPAVEERIGALQLVLHGWEVGAHEARLLRELHPLLMADPVWLAYYMNADILALPLVHANTDQSFGDRFTRRAIYTVKPLMALLRPDLTHRLFPPAFRTARAIAALPMRFWTHEEDDYWAEAPLPIFPVAAEYAPPPGGGVVGGATLG
jgi:hypothetical protein